MNLDSVFETLRNRNTAERCAEVRYAVVYAVVSGLPVLRFTGETGNSPKSYKCLKSYVPAVGDRVMLLDDVILGGIK